MFIRRRKRRVPGLNTTSTADISFILLVFFLVISSMDPNKGIRKLLPPAEKDNTEQKVTEMDSRNVLEITIGKSGQLMVDGRPLEMGRLKERVAGFVRNCPQRSRHVVNITMLPDSRYDDYFHVQKASWAIVEKENCTRSTLNNIDTSYKSPMYISKETGKSIGISNLIHIKLKDSKDKKILEELESSLHISIYSQNEYLPLWYTVFCQDNSHGNSLELCNKLQESNKFAYVEPDIMIDLAQGVTSFVAPNDPLYSDQWNLHGKYSINWEEASLLANGKGVKIGLIDTGVDATHPDYDSQKVYHAYDAYIGDWFANGLYSSHGMACAGTIVTIPNNKKGLVGIASNSELQSYSDPLTARPNISQNLASDLCIAFNSTDVVSCSWGGNDLNSSEIKEAITYYASWGRNNKGVIIVFASGNDSGPVTFPANYDEKILVVGASNKFGNKANFSNYGKEIDVVAPGVDIPTTGWTESDTSTYNYIKFSGTSAACPQVAAVAALVLSINPNLTSKEVCDIIEKTAQKVGSKPYSTYSNRPNGTWNEYMGYGLVDAAAAVKAAKSTLK